MHSLVSHVTGDKMLVFNGYNLILHYAHENTYAQTHPFYCRGEQNKCKCDRNCDDSNFFVQDFVSVLKERKGQSWFQCADSLLLQRSRMWFLGANLQWGINDYPKMKLRRDVLFRFEDLLGKQPRCVLRVLACQMGSGDIPNWNKSLISVYIGGTAGLFLGCSLLSLTEFIYFFTWRFVKFLCTKNWNELH